MVSVFVGSRCEWSYLQLRTGGARLGEDMKEEGLTGKEGTENIPIEGMTSMITILDVTVVVIIAMMMAMKMMVVNIAIEAGGVVGEGTTEVEITTKAAVMNGEAEVVATTEVGGVITTGEGGIRTIIVGVEEIMMEGIIVKEVVVIIVEEGAIAVVEEAITAEVGVIMEGEVGGTTGEEGGITGVVMKEVEEGIMEGRITMKAMVTEVGGAEDICVEEEEVEGMSTRMIILRVRSITRITIRKRKGALMTSTTSKVIVKKIMTVMNIMKITAPKIKSSTASRIMTVARKNMAVVGEPTVTVAGMTMKMMDIVRDHLITRKHMAATASNPRHLDPAPGHQTAAIPIPVQAVVVAEVASLLFRHRSTQSAAKPRRANIGACHIPPIPQRDDTLGTTVTFPVPIVTPTQKRAHLKAAPTTPLVTIHQRTMILTMTRTPGVSV